MVLHCIKLLQLKLCALSQAEQLHFTGLSVANQCQTRPVAAGQLPQTRELEMGHQSLTLFFVRVRTYAVLIQTQFYSTWSGFVHSNIHQKAPDGLMHPFFFFIFTNVLNISSIRVKFSVQVDKNHHNLRFFCTNSSCSSGGHGCILYL